MVSGDILLPYWLHVPKCCLGPRQSKHNDDVHGTAGIILSYWKFIDYEHTGNFTAGNASYIRTVTIRGSGEQ